MMKFQGKKSGKYAGFIGWFDQQNDNGWDDIIVVHSESGIGNYKRDKYKTIAEFNKDWEDYEEPQEAEPEKALPEEELDDLWREIKNTNRLLDSLNTRVRALERGDENKNLGKFFGDKITCSTRKEDHDA